MPYPKKPPNLKRIPIHVTISPQAKKRLDKLATETGLPISRIVDQIILEGEGSPREREAVTIPASVGPDIEALIEKQRDRQKRVNKLLKRG